MQKTDFELVKPLPRNLHVYPAKFDEFSRQSFTFSKLIIFSVKGHEVLKNLSKVKSKTFYFTGENDKFNQGNKERGMTGLKEAGSWFSRVTSNSYPLPTPTAFPQNRGSSDPG